MNLLVALAVAAFAGVVAALVASSLRRAAEREQEAQERAAQTAAADAIRLAATREAEAIKAQAEIDARAAAQQRRQEEQRAAEAEREKLQARQREAERRERELERRRGAVEEKGQALAPREQLVKDRDAAARARRDEAKGFEAQLREGIERLAGETANDVKSRLVAEWLDEAKTQAAERLRRIEAGMNDPEHGRTAKRVMDIAVGRYHGHYLTERLLTNLPIAPGALERIAGPSETHLRVIEEVSHVKLQPAETGEAIRLDGQDSFGREIARRAIARFAKNPPPGGDEAKKICVAISEELEREVTDLGRRAFKELEIPRSHPDIVKLVGRLNWRTSYTQNQWKHAIEAAFLCGMMASELGLDVKVARRAALMHDIGKALTHEIDGSHAVIGADLARKLGESELVANAIGAHHTDEPFNSAYAYLVAAADAMSGARPGARRQQDDNYAERLQDLERIASGYPGVERVYAVHGGREVRVHVQEGRVSDVKAVEMSTEIAHRISDEMTFPGQIKVTIIREVRAVATAS